MVILMITQLSYSENDTEKIAYELAKNLNKNSVLVLSGELGAGKTKFVKGIAKYFGIENEISSPTFTIVNEYTPKTNNDNVKKIFHFDVYRLRNSDDFIDSVGTEYFEEGMLLIEWGEIIQDILPRDTIYVRIEKDETKDTDTRIITIEGV